MTTPTEMLAQFDVSRETTERLEAYVAILKKWTAKINLIGRGEVDQLWRRHILDSLQLGPLAPNGARLWCDIGTGAGLPGLPVAIWAMQHAPEMRVALVESDMRKCAFLAEAARAADVKVDIHPKRIEHCGVSGADVVSARALAPLADLLALSEPLLKPGGLRLFLKGRRVADELSAAAAQWHIGSSLIPSLSDSEGAVISITAATRRSEELSS